MVEYFLRAFAPSEVVIPMVVTVLEAAQSPGLVLPVAAQGLLAELHPQQEGEATVAFEGTAVADADGTVTVRGRLVAQVPMQCARCGRQGTLEAVAETEDRFVHAPANAARHTLPDDCHGYSGSSLDLAPLCNEWLALALPFAPVCEDFGLPDCAAS